MGNLLNLKKFLSLERAAIHLSEQLNETYTADDLLQLSMDGHLSLSVNFVNNVLANVGKQISEDDINFEIYPAQHASNECLALLANSAVPAKAKKDWFQTMPDNIRNLFEIGELTIHDKSVLITGECRYQGHYFEFDNEVVILDGLFRLSMAGGEGQDVEDAFQRLSNGKPIQRLRPNLALVEDDDGNFFQLLEQTVGLPALDPQSYYPANGLPNDADIVVQTPDILLFIERLSATRTVRNKDTEAKIFRRQCMLEAIASLKINPKELPKADRGKAGVRKKVFEYCINNFPNDFALAHSVIENDWQDMRDEGVIIDKK